MGARDSKKRSEKNTNDRRNEGRKREANRMGREKSRKEVDVEGMVKIKIIVKEQGVLDVNGSQSEEKVRKKM